MVAPLPFVGRDREISRLRTALDTALGGQGTVALLSGEAGIGKTTLAEVLCDEAKKRGALVLTGRCYDLTETAPFAPWIEIFSAYPQDSTLPALPDSVASLDIGGAVSQAALFTTIRHFLDEVTTVCPVVLLLDDLHWADDASLDLLRFLARQAGNLPLLLLVTFRGDELTPAHYLSQLLPLLAREARALRLNLGPLSYDDLWAIIRPRYQLDPIDEYRLTSYLHSRTEGNPFYARELLQTIEDEGVLRQEVSGWVLGDLDRARTPVLVEHTIGRRLAQLPEGDQQLLAVAAVLGQEVPLELWSAVAETSQEQLLELLDQATRHRLMAETPDGRGARFTHALIRQVIYGRIPPSRRRMWHQRAGTLLAATVAPDPDAVANHLRRSGDSQAVKWLIQAGERAQRASSWQMAAERFEAAVELLGKSDEDAEKRGWLLVRAARLRRYSAPEVGLARLEAAGQIAEATGNQPLAATVLWQSGLLYCLRGSIRQGVDLLAQGVNALRTLTPADRERLIASGPLAGFLPDDYQDQGTLAMWLAGAGRYAEAIEYASPYLSESIVPEGAEGAFGDAYTTLGYAHAMLGDPEESRAAFARARAAYRDDQHVVHLARAISRELRFRVLNYETDNLSERRRLEAEAEAAWKRGRGTHAGDFAGAMRLPSQYIAGNWSELCETAQALLAHGTSIMRADATYLLGLVALAQGNTDLIRDLVEEWLPGGPATSPGDTPYDNARHLQMLAAYAAVDAGDYSTARLWLDAGDRWLAWSGALISKPQHLLTWAAYYRATGDPLEARRHAETACDIASDPRQPLALIATHRFIGEIDTAEGRYAEAAHHLDSSLTLAEACAAPYERALTLLAMAELDLAQDYVDGATNKLAAARPVFESLDAQPSLERARSLATRIERLRSTGRPDALREPAQAVSERDLQILAELSPREIDVLRLLPAGLTNQEIADQLFLSPKTVENHISRILAKTSLPNRAAAAAFAQRVGLA